MAATILIAVIIGLAVAVELTSYTTTISITGFQQFSQGTTSFMDSLPQRAGDSICTRNKLGTNLNPDNTSTYAFNVTTDSHEACSVEINLAAAVSSDFSSFQITVYSWAGSAWSLATLYTTATGSTPLAYIDGTTASTSGYIQQSVSTSNILPCSNRLLIYSIRHSRQLLD